MKVVLTAIVMAAVISFGAFAQCPSQTKKECDKKDAKSECKCDKEDAKK